MNPLKSSQETSTSAQALATLQQVLELEGWRPQPLQDKPIYRLDFSTERGHLVCFAQIRDEVQQFAFYAIAPIQTPVERRVAVAEFLTRANYGLWIGNFELDFEDGEVRYKSSLDFDGTDLQPELIRNAVYPALDTMLLYLPGLINVINGQKPLEALLELDGGLGICGIG